MNNLKDGMQQLEKGEPMGSVELVYI